MINYNVIYNIYDLFGINFEKRGYLIYFIEIWYFFEMMCRVVIMGLKILWIFMKVIFMILRELENELLINILCFYWFVNMDYD